jgi:hypothetical protein
MLLQQARGSVACLTGPAAEELVRDLVGQVKDARIRHKSLEKLLVQAYRDLPFNNHLDSIKGFGEVTAAILTAKIVDPHRFVEPGKLVGFFGVYPVEASSGIDRDGNPRLPIRMIMSKRGNDLVRRYLWMAALSAAQHNPAVKPLYQRIRAKHPDQPSIAIGHVMRKLLHIALAVWKSDKPFDPEHYPWDKPAHLSERRETVGAGPEGNSPEPSSDLLLSQTPQAAGHNNPGEPERSVVTAACGTTSVPQDPAAGNAPSANDTTAGPPRTHESDIPLSLRPAPDPVAQGAKLWIDFDHVKSQLPLECVLAHLGLLPKLRGTAHQRRGPCPLHDHGKGKGRTFSVQLDKNVFQCFDVRCGKKGDVIDLWAAVRGVNLRDAAVDLVTTFNLEPAPRTEKRNG